MISYELNIIMLPYENALFTVQVTRKHFFKDKNYSLYLFSDELVMTDVYSSSRLIRTSPNNLNII